MLLAYIWNVNGRLPSEILSLPPFEKEFIYQSTMLKIEAEKKANKKK